MKFFIPLPTNRASTEKSKRKDASPARLGYRVICVVWSLALNLLLCAAVPASAAPPNLLKPINDSAAWEFPNFAEAKSTHVVERDTVLITITKPGTADWHIQASQKVSGIQEGHRYLLTVRLRANQTQPVLLFLTTTADFRHDVGLGVVVTATLDWQTFRQTFTAGNVTGRQCVFQMMLGGGAAGKVRIAEVQLTEIPDGDDAVGAQPSGKPTIAAGRAFRTDGSLDYRFDGSISRPVLENYLARAITESGLLSGQGNVADNIRMLKNISAKFAGRAVGLWGQEAYLPQTLATAKPIVQKVHEADADIILQAAAFEIVTRQVKRLPVSAKVFEEFGLPVEDRTFDYEAMLYKDGHLKNHWATDASVPDMSQRETRMWFFYLSMSYIDVGIEALHFGQVGLMDKNDPNHAHWQDMLTRVRRYAVKNARRHFVLCDAHVPNGGIMIGNQLLFDLHTFPLRIKAVQGKPQEGVLEVGYLDSLYGRSRGGVTPSGWRCEHLPYMVELDNWSASGKEGQYDSPDGNPIWVWGYDEISWFAHQSETNRNEWLRYAWRWVREHDPNGYLQMPGSRTLAAPVRGKNGNLHTYWANTLSRATPTGFNQEGTIKDIWTQDNPKAPAVSKQVSP